MAPAGITWKHWDVNPARLQNRVCFPTGPPPTVFATAERGYLRHRGCWGTPAHLGPGRAPGSHLSGQTCWTQAVSGRRLGTWPAGQLSRCLLPARPPGSCTARRPGELPLQSDPSDLRWRRNKHSPRRCCERPSFVLKNLDVYGLTKDLTTCSASVCVSITRGLNCLLLPLLIAP